MRKRGLIIIYPAYLDASKSRQEGRRVPRSITVKRPTISEIERALKSLGLKYQLEKDKSYPKCWWEEGRFLVEKIMPKQKLLKILAKELSRLRSLKK